MGEKNFDTIFEEIRNFINPNNEPDLPLLYTMSDHIPCVESILKQLALEICHDETEASEMFSICSIDKLFFELKQNSPEPLSSHFMAKILLNKDHYDHSPGLACKFHDDQDIPRHCAQAMVTRWAYTVCDNICNSLDIKMIPGKHVPMNCDVNFKLVKPGDADDPTNVWNVNKPKIKDDFIPKKMAEMESPALYETVYVNGKANLQLKDDTKPDVQIKEEPVLLKNPFAMGRIGESDSLREDTKNTVIVKPESMAEIKPILVKQEEDEEITYSRASVISKIVENPFARKERKVDPNSCYGLVKQLKEIHEESDDEIDGFTSSLVYEDRIGQTGMKRKISYSSDGTVALEEESSSSNKRYLGTHLCLEFFFLLFLFSDAQLLFLKLRNRRHP